MDQESLPDLPKSGIGWRFDDRKPASCAVPTAISVTVWSGSAGSGRFLRFGLPMCKAGTSSQLCPVESPRKLPEISDPARRGNHGPCAGAGERRGTVSESGAYEVRQRCRNGFGPCRRQANRRARRKPGPEIVELRGFLTDTTTGNQYGDTEPLTV